MAPATSTRTALIPLYRSRIVQLPAGDSVSRTRVDILDGYAVVDSADAARLMQYTWRPTPGGYACRFERRAGRGFAIRMHREILGLAPDNPLWGDHINGDRLDNLRAVTPRENRHNSRGYGRSGIKGVYWNKHAGRWEAKLSLGLFDTTDEALGVVEAAREFIREFGANT